MRKVQDNSADFHVQVEDFSGDASRIFRPLQYERYVILKTVVVSGGIRSEGWVEEGDKQGKNDRGSNFPLK
jgi:hypothetical protein